MADDDRRREILESVAAGTMTPAEAAERLAALDALAEHEQSASARRSAPSSAGRGGWDGLWPPFAAPGDPFESGRETRTTHSTAGVRRVRVSAAFRSVRIVGDPGVREAVADGEHTATIEGDTLVIDGESGLEGLPAAFAFSHGERVAQRVRISGRKVRPLTVRMNADLALDIDASAGSVTVDGVRGPISATCAAGALRIDGFASELDLTVSAGSISARGRLDSGESRIQCDAGKVSLQLDRSSSVAVATRVNLGKVTFGFEDVEPSSTTRAGGSSSCVIGGGAGRLDISCNLGSVQVDVQ